jgi:hypothetical protein
MNATPLYLAHTRAIEAAAKSDCPDFHRHIRGKVFVRRDRPGRICDICWGRIGRGSRGRYPCQAWRR